MFPKYKENISFKAQLYLDPMLQKHFMKKFSRHVLNIIAELFWTSNLCADVISKCSAMNRTIGSCITLSQGMTSFNDIPLNLSFFDAIHTNAFDNSMSCGLILWNSSIVAHFTSHQILTTFSQRWKRYSYIESSNENKVTFTIYRNILQDVLKMRKYHQELENRTDLIVPCLHLI